jgi:hypothetical protein
MMPFEHFETTFRKDLLVAGLREFIDWKSSQFLDCGSEFFVELVLNEGSRIPQAEGLLAQAATDLGKDGAILDSVVRAAWAVKEIKRIGLAVSSNGSPMASNAFIAELKSGNATCMVSVNVTFSAIELLRRKHADTSRSNERSLPVNEIAAVQRYLERQLSLGGTSYWNPLKYDRRELNEPAMLYLCSIGMN